MEGEISESWEKRQTQFSHIPNCVTSLLWADPLCFQRVFNDGLGKEDTGVASFTKLSVLGPLQALSYPSAPASLTCKGFPQSPQETATVFTE